ncbi:LuxR C-terminal-related transcriptional regulator [Thermophilibacter mediterraneus]|uniref:LuxR C-terminal-related transcriptional regulator n=1 Tax=Thermophilibacter mediterraneus TaxID=1871031 RepID=UPI002352540A|nr:LuxR C-terminal-related transcriptional regulator [Thermophilibacter mediterraneus]
MDYITVAEAARRWGVTARLVQGYCARGRVDGAEKFSGSWRIPVDAPKPRDLRCGGSATDRGQGAASASMGGLMPLMNTPFAPGGARAAVEGLADGARRDIARAELAYFTGLADEALAAAEPHLGSEDLGVRLSANLICAYANLPLGRIDRARGALEAVRGAVAEASERDPRLRAAEGFVAQAASVLLHLPAPDPVPEAREVMPLLPPGLRAFAFYVQAHAAYLSGDHARSLGVAETALLGMGDVYPIPAIYLHLVAVMSDMALRRADEARAHLLAAWELARPDGLIEPLAEHHGLLGGMLEAAIKPAWPDDFRRIIDITYRFSAGWRRVHNPATGDDVADNLTTTEFATCMLAARGWSNAEIAAHMGISPNTVKSYVSAALRKLGITRRRDLSRFMLS